MGQEEQEQGVPPQAGSGHSAEPEPCSTVSAVPVGIPNAIHVSHSVRAQIMRAIADPGLVTERLRTPDGLYETLSHWQARAALDAVFLAAATSSEFADTLASAIEAGTDATPKDGSTESESAVPQDIAPNTTSQKDSPDV